MRDPVVLRRWEASRSGSSMTIHGTNVETGVADRLTNIVTITPPANNAAHEVVARDKDGVEHRLVYP